MVEVMGFDPQEYERFHVPTPEEEREAAEAKRLREGYLYYKRLVLEYKQEQDQSQKKISVSEFGAQLGKSFVRAFQAVGGGRYFGMIEELRNDLVIVLGEERARKTFSGFLAEYTAARLFDKFDWEIFFPKDDEALKQDRIEKIDWFVRNPKSNQVYALTVKSFLLSEDAFFENSLVYALDGAEHNNKLIDGLINSDTIIGQTDAYEANEKTKNDVNRLTAASSKYGVKPLFVLVPNSTAKYIDPKEDINPNTGEPGGGLSRIFKAALEKVSQQENQIKTWLFQ